MRALVTLPLSVALAAAPLVFPSTTLAAAAPEAAESMTSEDAAARSAYQEGSRQYEIGNYEQALDAWVRAYSLVPDTAENLEILGKLRLNIARAHEKLFEIHGDPASLRRAKALLETHLRVLPSIYEDPGALDEAVAEARQRLDRIEALLAGAEPGPDPVPIPAPATDPRPAPTASPPTPGATAPAPAASPAPRSHEDAARPGRGLIVGGSVFTVLGAGGLAVMIAGMATASAANDFTNDLDGREDQIASGRRGNVMSVAGAAAGGAFLVTGIVLLAAGAAKNKRSRVTTALAPTGLALTARF